MQVGIVAEAGCLRFVAAAIATERLLLFQCGTQWFARYILKLQAYRSVFSSFLFC